MSARSSDWRGTWKEDRSPAVASAQLSTGTPASGGGLPGLHPGVDHRDEAARTELTVAPEEVPIGHDGGRTRVVEHVGDLGRGQSRIHGDGHATGPVGGGVRDEPVQRQLGAQVDADPVIGPEAGFDQAAGHGVGRAVPLGEGHGAHVDHGESRAVAELLSHPRQVIVHQHRHPSVLRTCSEVMAGDDTPSISVRVAFQGGLLPFGAMGIVAGSGGFALGEPALARIEAERRQIGTRCALRKRRAIWPRLARQGQTVSSMEPPEIRYVSIGDGDVAYQVLGEGPGDLLFCNSLGGHVDLIWQIPQAAEFLEKLATLRRVLHMDRRGSGASDAVSLKAIPTWEELAEDITGVLDATGSTAVDLVGVNEVSPMAVLFAAMHPERVGSLILINTSARYIEAPDYPIGVDPATIDGSTTC